MKITFWVLICLLMGGGLMSGSLSQAQTSLQGDRAMVDCGSGELVKLYEKKIVVKAHEIFRSTNDKRSYGILQYVKFCAKNAPEVEALLKRNRFKFINITDPDEMDRINKEYRQSKESWSERYSDYQNEYYDQLISGSRGPIWWMVWKQFNSTKYTITIFLKDGEVRWVSGIVDATMF